jgi:HlyD family secretion protein
MANSSNSGWLKWLVILAVLGGGGYAAWKWQAKRGSASAVPDLRTNVVSRGEITQAVTANGALNPVRIVTVGSQISGIITELNVDFNSKVKEGDVLAKIDASTYERALARAKADLANAQAGLELAQYTFKHGKELFDAKLVSESDYESNLAALHQAEANVKIRQASWWIPRRLTSTARSSPRPSPASSSRARWTRARPWRPASTRPKCSPSPTTSPKCRSRRPCPRRM